jgi:hypothetical protein
MESTGKERACPNWTCKWSRASALKALIEAEDKRKGDYQEQWLDNLLFAAFPFSVDYTETAWDPCVVGAVIDKGDEHLAIMGDSEHVKKLDITIASHLRDWCVSNTVSSRDLRFARLGITGYDNDARGLFQIPEVIHLVQHCE